MADSEKMRCAEDFAAYGIAVIEAVVPMSAVAPLRGLAEFSLTERPGQRLFSVPPAVAELIAPAGVLTKTASRLIGETARPVRVLYFDKRPGMNWGVPWHQDRTIAVARRVDVPGYGSWSVKAGIDHVEPPQPILQGMVSIRLHVDECCVDNGPLLALRGSFRLGRIPATEIRRYVDAGATAVCCARAGDVVAMRGLTIHASERAQRPGHRRVVHVDYATMGLPGGLEWAMPPLDGNEVLE